VPAAYWSDRVKLVPIGNLSLRPLESYRARGCDFVLANSFIYGPVLRQPDLYPEAAAFYRRLFAEWPLVAEFTYSDRPFVKTLLGEEFEVYDPVIRIYRVPAAADA
jgi:hypothetical protein